MTCSRPQGPDPKSSSTILEPMTSPLAPVPVMSIRFVFRTVAAPHMCAVLSLTIEIRVPERVIFSSKRSFIFTVTTLVCR
jgi:hypothetical protein